jgi:hypothetical protein
MEQVLTNDDPNVVQYVIKVNGVPVSAPFGDKMLAEMAKNNLPEEQRMIAEVVPITTDGKQILLG